MGIEIDFGRELGRLAFPDDITEEQAQSYARENYQAIRQGLIAKRQEELAAETEAEEKARFQLGQYGAVETALNTLSELPRGALEGIGQTLKGVARLPSAIPGPTYDPYTEVPLEQDPLYSAGQAVQEFGQETYPGLPGVRETVPAQIMAGIGSTVSTLPAAVIAGPVGAAVSYGLQSGESAAEEADTTINRRIAEALANRQYDLAADLQDSREQKKNLAFITTAPIGAATEGLLGAAPKIVKRFATGRIGGIGERLAERLVPQSARYQRRFLGVTGAERVRGAVEALATEGVQESAEQLGGNIAAAAVYDPERGWLDGVAQAGFIGAASGGIVGGLVGSRPNAKLANAAAESLGGDPTNPLPRANATVAGMEDGTQPTGPIEIEPEVTAEEVLRMSRELGIPVSPEMAQAPAAQAPAAVAEEPTVGVRKTSEFGADKENREYQIDAGGQRAGQANLARNEDGTWRVEMVVVDTPGMGIGPKAYEQIHSELEAEGSGLTSGSAGSLSESALRMWEKLVSTGKAEKTGQTYRMKPTSRAAAVTPAPATVTPAAPVDTETGLTADEQDELDQLITAEDAGLLSEEGAITLAAYRSRLGFPAQPQAPTPSAVQEQGADEGVLRREEPQPAVEVELRQVDQGGRPAEVGGAEAEVTPEEVQQVKAEVVPEPAPAPATPAAQSAKLPKKLAGARPRYSISFDTYLPRFDSDFDLAAYIVTQTKKSKNDADYLNWAVERSGMTPEQVRQHGLKVRAELKQLASRTKPGTSEKPAAFTVPSVAISMPEVKVTPTPAPAPAQAPAPTPAPTPEYTPARINKLFQTLKARATAVGKGLYEIKKLAPGQRVVLRNRFGGLQETDQFLLREKSQVTGNPSDEGYILRDKQEYMVGEAPRTKPVPTPTPAPTPAEPTLQYTDEDFAAAPSREAASNMAVTQVRTNPSLPPRPPQIFYTLEAVANRAAKKPYDPKNLTAELIKQAQDSGLLTAAKNPKLTADGQRSLADGQRQSQDRKAAQANLSDALRERAVLAWDAANDPQSAAYKEKNAAKSAPTPQADPNEKLAAFIEDVDDAIMNLESPAKLRAMVKKAVTAGYITARDAAEIASVQRSMGSAEDTTDAFGEFAGYLNMELEKRRKAPAAAPVTAPAAPAPAKPTAAAGIEERGAVMQRAEAGLAGLRPRKQITMEVLLQKTRNEVERLLRDGEITEDQFYQYAKEWNKTTRLGEKMQEGPLTPAPAAPEPAKKAAKDPATMTASEINKELDRLDAESSAVTQELIDTGRGSELTSETLKKTDPLSLRAVANNKRQSDLRREISARYGPNAPSRLPAGQKGFGPTKKAPKTTAQSAIEAIDKVSKGLSENQYSDPLFLTPLAKLALQIAKGLIQVGVAVDKAIRQAIAQARQQFPNDPADDIQLADRLIRDAQYTEAVAAGDMETAQRMVDEAAVKAGYKTKGFHRTPKAFTEFIPGGPKAEAQFWTTKAGEFRTLFGQSGRAIWFGSSPENLPAYHNDPTGNGVVLEVYLKNPSPLQIDDDTRDWGRDLYADGSKQFPLLLSDEHIRSIRKDGYTGIEYWNNGKTADKSAPDEMVVFDATQIKSADPVTRDDDGNVVPLSQRFQSSTADIRGASGANRGIGKRLSDWARNDTDEATRQVRFTNPSTGEQATFGDVISDLQSISDEAAPEYVRWLQSIPNKSTETANIVSDITWISRLGAEAERNQRPDRVEAALQKVIAATDPKGKAFEAITALSSVVIYQATKIALRIYQATKSWVAARNAGMDYIKSHVQLQNEPETAANFEEFLKAVPNQEIPAGTPDLPQPPSPAERVESRGLFLGEIERDTDENWASEAKKWVDFFNGNLERAYQVALTADIDNAFKEYILGEIIQRNQLDIARAKNDVEVLRALNLEKRLADSAKSLGAITAKAMAARKLAQERFWWAQPAMILRNLIRKRQDELIPFSKIESEQVRKWLTESGREAVNQIREAMKKADNVFAREFRKIKQVPGEPDGPPIEIKWQDILTQALDTQGSVRQKMLQVILADPRLRNLSPAGIAEITNLLTKAWETKRNQIFRAEFQKKVPLPNVKPDVREKLLRSLPRILKYANIARATPGSFSIQDGPDTFLLWEQAFRDAVAPEFGVAELNGATARKITDLAQKAQAQSGVNRNEIIQQMFRLMAREGGVKFSDALRDYWYAAVLSGIRTQVDNWANVYNGFLNTAMFATMAKKDAGFIAYSALKGLDEGIRDFWPMLWRGELYRSVNFNPDQPGSALEGLGQSRNLFAKGISQFKYVGRLINALDHMTALMSDSTAKAYALRKLYGPELARQYLTPSPEVVAAARVRAIAEGTRPELVNKRTREIIQEKLPVEILLTAKEIREMTTFTETPQGLLGSLYRGLDQAAQGKTLYKVLSGTNFLRFAANSANEILNFALPVALYRYYQSAPGKSEGEYGLKFSESRRDLILAKAAFGTALGIFAGALFLGDDDKEEDRNIDITGSFKSLDPNKRKQLLAEGRQPYSIRFGNTYVSYRQLGFGGVLATIGELRDRQLFSPDKWSQENIVEKVLDGAAAGMFIVKDSTAISGLTELLGFANAYKYDTDEFIEKSFPRYVSRLAGSLVPNILKEVDAWSDPSIFKTEAGNLGYEYFLQQVPFGRREIGPGPILNVLGEPVKVERYPWSRWAKEREDDLAWGTLGKLASRGVFMPTPAITVKVNENGTRREMTREEKYQYQQAVGQGYRKFIEQNSKRLLALPPAEAADFIDKNADRIRRNARTNLKNSF
jgi:hypothetical protein